jgi:hypothetical protein
VRSRVCNIRNFLFARRVEGSDTRALEEVPMRRGLVGSIAAVGALALLAPAGASARAGDRTLAETYPVATALCAKARSGALPPRLAGDRAQVLTACDTLENAFGPLVSAVDNAEAAFLTTLANQRTLVATACARPVADAAACRAARTTRRSADAAALAARAIAVTQFHASVKANRDTFWATIRALRSAG